MQVSGIIFPLIVFPYVTRKIGVGGYGEFSIAQAYSLYLIVIVSIGLGTYGVRESSRLRENASEIKKFVTNMIVSTFLISLVAYTVYIYIILDSNLGYETKIAAIVLGAAGPINALSSEWYIVGTERFKYIAIRGVLTRIVIVLCIFNLVHTKEDLVLYVVLNLFNISAVNLWNLIIIAKDRAIDFALLSIQYCILKLKEAFGLYLMLLISQIFSSIDIIIMSFYVSSYEVGLYSFALKTSMMMFNVAVSVMYAILPRVMSSDNNESTAALINQKTLQFVLFTSMVLMWALCLLPNQIVQLLGGEGYNSSVLMLQILSPIIVANSVNYFLAFQVLIPRNSENKYAVALLMSGIMGSVVLWGLVYHFGAVGASWGTVVSIITQAIMLIYLSVDIIKLHKLTKCSIEVLVWFTIAAVISIMLILGGFSPIIAYIIFSMLMAFGCISKNIHLLNKSSFG